MADKPDEDVAVKRQEAAAEVRVGGPAAGFSKGVNDYLNHYVTVADAKAGAVLAGVLVVAGFIMPEVRLTTLWGCGQALAVALLLVSAGCAISVLYPRLPSDRRGVIFWEDIRTRKSADEYWQQLNGLDNLSVEREYSFQNYYVSGVLHRKLVLVQRAMVAFAVGTAGCILCRILG